MIPICCVIGPDRPAFSLQAGDDQHVRQHPDADEARPILRHGPPFIPVIDRQVTRPLSVFGPAQQEIGVQGTEDRRGAGIGQRMDTHRNAGQPVLRALEAAESKSLNVASTVPPQGLVSTSSARVSAFTGSPSATRSSDPCTAKPELDAAYQHELAAWVASAVPDDVAKYWLAEGAIHAYLERPEEYKWSLSLVEFLCSTLPPLPANLKELSVDCTKLSAPPENLPQGLQELYVVAADVIALPENLPQGLQRLFARYTQLRTLPENLPRALRTLEVFGSALTAEALLTCLQTNTSITSLFSHKEVLTQGIADQLAINKERLAHLRLANAAASLDLLTRLAFTMSDQTGKLINRASTRDPVAGRLPEPSIPAELHDVLAANCSKDLLRVLAGMVDDRCQ